MTEPIEPTDDEKRNGWTTETLTDYVAEREASMAARIDPSERRQPPLRVARGYSPFRWRR